MKLCILHCGHPKTGTSSLQRFLASNSARLADHGILYPRLQRPGRPAAMPWVGSQHGLALKMLAKGADWTRPKDELERLDLAIDTTPHDVLLLSAEYLFGALFYHRMPRLWHDLQRRGYQIETISYLRDQPERLSSAYAQQCKLGTIRGGFDEFCASRTTAAKNVHGLRGSMFYDRLIQDGLHDWGHHQFRPFGTEVKARGVEVDFIGALREVLAKHQLAATLTEAEAAALEQKPRLNDADGVILVAVCRSLTGRMAAWLKDRAPTEAQRRQIGLGVFHRARAAIAQLGIVDPKYTAVTPGRRLALRDLFAQSNQDFARKVWGQDWEAMFPQPDPSTLASNDLDDTNDPELRALHDRALAVAERNFAEAARAVMAPHRRKRGGGGRQKAQAAP